MEQVVFSEIRAEDLSAAAGVLLSLGFSYVPGLRQRFASLTPTHKRLVMLGLLVVTAGAAFGLGCAGAFSISCTQAGAWGLLRVLLAAVVANQAAFALSPQHGEEGPA